MTSVSSSPSTRPWGDHPIGDGAAGRLTVGPLNLWLRGVGDEALLAFDREGAVSEVDDPEHLRHWTRAVRMADGQTLRLRPALPDRPVVVKPESPFLLTPGSTVRIFVRIPVAVRVEIGSAPARTLLEIPTVILANTWFGTLTEGELCYWTETAARRRMEPDPDKPHLAICSLAIHNGADEPLSVEKICIRVMHLSLFDAAGQLWTDDMKVHYRGGGKVSRLEVTGKPPSEAGAATQAMPPRVAQVGFAGRTFMALKALPGMGASEA